MARNQKNTNTTNSSSSAKPHEVAPFYILPTKIGLKLPEVHPGTPGAVWVPLFVARGTTQPVRYVVIGSGVQNVVGKLRPVYPGAQLWRCTTLQAWVEYRNHTIPVRGVKPLTDREVIAAQMLADFGSFDNASVIETELVICEDENDPKLYEQDRIVKQMKEGEEDEVRPVVWRDVTPGEKGKERDNDNGSSGSSEEDLPLISGPLTEFEAMLEKEDRAMRALNKAGAKLLESELNVLKKRQSDDWSQAEREHYVRLVKRGLQYEEAQNETRSPEETRPPETWWEKTKLQAQNAARVAKASIETQFEVTHRGPSWMWAKYLAYMLPREEWWPELKGYCDQVALRLALSETGRRVLFAGKPLSTSVTPAQLHAYRQFAIRHKIDEIGGPFHLTDERWQYLYGEHNKVYNTFAQNAGFKITGAMPIPLSTYAVLTSGIGLFLWGCSPVWLILWILSMGLVSLGTVDFRMWDAAVCCLMYFWACFGVTPYLTIPVWTVAALVALIRTHTSLFLAHTAAHYHRVVVVGGALLALLGGLLAGGIYKGSTCYRDSKRRKREEEERRKALEATLEKQGGILDQFKLLGITNLRELMVMMTTAPRLFEMGHKLYLSFFSDPADYENAYLVINAIDKQGTIRVTVNRGVTLDKIGLRSGYIEVYSEKKGMWIVLPSSAYHNVPLAKNICWAASEDLLGKNGCYNTTDRRGCFLRGELRIQHDPERDRQKEERAQQDFERKAGALAQHEEWTRDLQFVSGRKKRRLCPDHKEGTCLKCSEWSDESSDEVDIEQQGRFSDVTQEILAWAARMREEYGWYIALGITGLVFLVLVVLGYKAIAEQPPRRRDEEEAEPQTRKTRSRSDDADLIYGYFRSRGIDTKDIISYSTNSLDNGRPRTVLVNGLSENQPAARERFEKDLAAATQAPIFRLRNSNKIIRPLSRPGERYNHLLKVQPDQRTRAMDFAQATIEHQARLQTEEIESQIEEYEIDVEPTPDGEKFTIVKPVLPDPEQIPEEQRSITERAIATFKSWVAQPEPVDKIKATWQETVFEEMNKQIKLTEPSSNLIQLYRGNTGGLIGQLPKVNGGLLIPKHMLPTLRSETVLLQSPAGTASVRQVFKMDDCPESIKHLEIGDDLVWVPLNSLHPALFKQLQAFHEARVATKDEFKAANHFRYVGWDPRGIDPLPVNDYLSINRVRLVEGKKTRFEVDRPGFPGSCGSLLLACDKNDRVMGVIGVHIEGRTNGEPPCYCQPVFADMLPAKGADLSTLPFRY